MNPTVVIACLIVLAFAFVIMCALRMSSPRTRRCPHCYEFEREGVKSVVCPPNVTPAEVEIRVCPECAARIAAIREKARQHHARQ